MYRIAVASDHAGWEQKNRIQAMLISQGHSVEDCGTYNQDSCDYPDFAVIAVETVAKGVNDLAILICGTGIGMSISANKIKGIRAAICTNEEMAKLSREHNDCNVLCLGCRITESACMDKIISTWLASSFQGGRHSRRVEKISQIESKNCCS